VAVVHREVGPPQGGRLKEAGSLAATRIRPPGWSSAGALRRVIGLDYNCCGGQHASDGLEIEETQIPW
jgi:hypothetical protein